jgi:uncharacterized spore protein YtfJ
MDAIEEPEKKEIIMIEGQKASRVDFTEQSVEKFVNRLVDAARADAVFGQPVERGNATVIPCSEVIVGAGFGFGGGPVDEKGNQVGRGGGAGGNMRGRPIAAIVVTEDGVRVEPIMDLTKVALAGMSTGAFMLFWLLRLVRGAKGEKGLSFSRLQKAIEK